jgi:hypothetical protein
MCVVLQVVKTGGTPKVPDCFQRTPKKLCIPEKTEILAVNVDSKGKPFIVVYSLDLLKHTGLGYNCLRFDSEMWLDVFTTGVGEVKVC